MTGHQDHNPHWRPWMWLVMTAATLAAGLLGVGLVLAIDWVTTVTSR